MLGKSENSFVYGIRERFAKVSTFAARIKIVNRRFGGAALFIFAAAAIALSVTNSWADPIQNGSFESGNLTGWTLNPLTGSDYVSTGILFRDITFKPQDGRYLLLLGSSVLQDSLGRGTISQTISDGIGQTYSLGLYLASDGYAPNEFAILWNNTRVYDQLNIPSTVTNGNAMLLPINVHVTGTGNDVLTFYSRNVPGYLAIDNVTLTADAVVSTVPEPSSLALFGLGGIASAIGVFRRRCVVV